MALPKYLHCCARLNLLVPAMVLMCGLAGCSANSSKGAERGAKTGAVSGAVGGMVGALVFGGSVGDAAARGAVVGGAAGATAGAMSGAEKDKQAAAQAASTADAEMANLRKKIGEDSYSGVDALAKCKHQVAIAYASTAQTSGNADYELAGLWVEVLSYADQREEGTARDLFPKVIEADSDVATVADAETQMQESLLKLRNIREQYGLPKLCS
ncbi:MAG: hypothetical protein ACR2QG_04465 [Gammaproteobacteria bacterium]